MDGLDARRGRRAADPAAGAVRPRAMDRDRGGRRGDGPRFPGHRRPRLGQPVRSLRRPAGGGMTFRLTRSLAIVLASSLLSRTAIGQPDSARAATPGSELTISLITMGNGRYVWEFFGHNAFWIHDARAGTDRVYNWGVFDMRAPHFIPRFLRGTMMYRVDTLSLRETMLEYRYWNRSVVAQELNLTPAEREELRTFVDQIGRAD